MDILVVGGNGIVGGAVARELLVRGHTVRAPRRRELDARDPAAVAAAARGAGAIVDCAGASVAMGLGHGWRGYRAVDVPIGMACVHAARETGARLVYLGTFHAPAQADTPYVAAHEHVAREVIALGGSVVRPTGIFATIAQLLALARRGWLFDLGAGTARTNPVDERDVARVIAEALAGGPLTIDVGGPEVMSRREMFERVAAAAGRRVRIVGAPAWLGRIGGLALSLLHPRIGQFVRFAASLASHDTIAPKIGTTRFADYLRGSDDFVSHRGSAPLYPPWIGGS